MELTKSQQTVLDSWERMVCKRVKKIDPGSEHDWHSIWVGFAIASGLTIAEATNYDLYINHAFERERPIR